jgi:glycosyltransferase involved in cell wall biosynthesis
MGQPDITVDSDGRLVSVVIPTFNRAAMVLEAIASVRAQTWKQVEVIVVDDGSTDDTLERLRDVEDVIVVSQPNSGQAAARNHGLRLSTGDYVCTLDSDDLWHPTFLEESIGAMEALGADVVFANWVGEDVNGGRYESYFQKFYHWWNFTETEVPGWRAMRPSQTRAMFVDSCASPSSALVLRREQLATGWDESLKIGDDWCRLMELAVRTSCKLAFTMSPLWTKRVAFDNIYDQRDYVEVKRWLYVHDLRRVRERLKADLTRREYARLSALVAYHEWGLARHAMRHGARRDAVRYLASFLQDITVGAVRSPRQVADRIQSVSGRWARRPTPQELAGPKSATPVGPADGEDMVPVANEADELRQAA